MTTTRPAPTGTRRPRSPGVLRTLLMPMVGCAALFGLYFGLPLDRSFTAATVVALTLGLLAICVIVSIQVRQIMRSNFPRLRAVGALATSVPLFLLLFATTYYLMARGQTDAFSEPLTRTDSLYFTLTLFTTVGFGDIVPKIQVARVIVMVQMVGDLLLLGLFGRVVLGAVNQGLSRRGAATDRPVLSPEEEAL